MLVPIIAGIYFIVWPITAFSTMIVVGNMHNDWWSFIPPMGYGAALAISAIPVLITVVATFLKQTSSS